ncbi:hypothetical protein PR202_ga30455 [Eleusine coracana subsp. coracana]|uniref:BTB domain-containing protein n=1 Tax=Eleusine coracana subsp. coracana TaxID=191504 RepID=A0AAV5DNY6_ELECO|nr:hypothetical protein PR202_ga30455 [Eleusine coracana subsp. coracana]
MGEAPRSRGRRSGGGRAARVRARGWCCSFAGAPQSPDLRPLPPVAAAPSPGGGAGAGGGGWGRKLPPKSPSAPSFSSSPASSRLSSLGGLIDPRRILSPGRVSPIDPDGAIPPPAALPLPPAPPAMAAVETMELVPVEPPSAAAAASLALAPVMAAREEGGSSGELDLRLFLRGRDGRCVLMELDSTVLCRCSAFFSAMAPGTAVGEGKRIDVDGVENLEAFKAAVELMYEPDPIRWLAGSGVSRAIDVLEVRKRKPLVFIHYSNVVTTVMYHIWVLWNTN